MIQSTLGERAVFGALPECFQKFLKLLKKFVTLSK